MPRWLRRLRRSFLLGMLSRQTPTKLERVSRQRLQRTFQKAIARSPAYRAILAEANVDTSVRRSADEIIASVPLLQKADLFNRFAIGELLPADTSPADLASILTSSGHGGGKFAFGLSTREQLRHTPADIDLGLQLAFGIDSHSTLLVNCLPMGVVFSSHSVTVANVSVREDMALAIIEQAGPLFDQVVLCLDPLFCKRLLDYAEERGFDWASLRTNVILGEEMFSEDFRSYLADKFQLAIGATGGPMIASSMGVGELGLNLFFETAETIALRRSLYHHDPDQLLPAFFCYNPLRTFVEIVSPGPDGLGDLVVTMLDETALIPMIRYRTGDRARWVTEADRTYLLEPARALLEQQPFPMIAIAGRGRDQIDEHWHVDHIKALVYRRPELAHHLSGAFMLVQEDAGLWLDVQLGLRSDMNPVQVAELLQDLISSSARLRAATVPMVRCFAYARFPHGMSLDYERKFRYFQGP